MLTINGNPSGSDKIVRSSKLSEFNFGLAIRPTVRYENAGTVTEATVDDSVFEHHAGATIVHEGEAVVQYYVGVPVTPSLESRYPAIATVNSAGQLTYVNDGQASIVARTPFLSRTASINVKRDVSVNFDLFKHFASGSLARSCVDAVNSAIASKTPSDTTLLLFSSVNDGTQSYVRNSNLWIGSFDLTWAAVWNSHWGQAFNGALVSPRHLITAHHILGGVVPSLEGYDVRFVKADGTVVNRTFTDSVNIPDTDIEVAVLDSDVPSGISFAKVLPENWESYVPGVQNAIPAVYLPHSRTVRICEWRGRLSPGDVWFPQDTPIAGPWSAWFSGVVQGTSGTPIFLMIGSTPVLLGTWTANFASDISAYAEEINSAMTDLGGSYQLTEIDLSSFPTY